MNEVDVEVIGLQSPKTDVDLLVNVIGADNVVFASEMIGAVKSVDQRSGRYFDDTKPYIDAVPNITEADKRKIFETNALKVYPRLKNYVKVTA